jgi:hypothetical protein
VALEWPATSSAEGDGEHVNKSASTFVWDDSGGVRRGAREGTETSTGSPQWERQNSAPRCRDRPITGRSNLCCSCLRGRMIFHQIAAVLRAASHGDGRQKRATGGRKMIVSRKTSSAIKALLDGSLAYWCLAKHKSCKPVQFPINCTALVEVIDTGLGAAGPEEGGIGC